MYTVKNGLKTANSGPERDAKVAQIDTLVASVQTLNNNLLIFDKKLLAINQSASNIEKQIKLHDAKFETLQRLLLPQSANTSLAHLDKKLTSISQSVSNAETAIKSLEARLQSLIDLTSSLGVSSVSKDFYTGSGVIVALSGLLLSIALFSYIIFHWIVAALFK